MIVLCSGVVTEGIVTRLCEVILVGMGGEIFCGVVTKNAGGKIFCGVATDSTGGEIFCGVATERTGGEIFCGVITDSTGGEIFCGVATDNTGGEIFCGVATENTGGEIFCGVTTDSTGGEIFCGVATENTGGEIFCGVATEGMRLFCAVLNKGVPTLNPLGTITCGFSILANSKASVFLFSSILSVSFLISHCNSLTALSCYNKQIKINIKAVHYCIIFITSLKL